MSTATTTLQLRGFGKQRLAAIRNRAKSLGLSPQQYLKQLVEDDLAVSEQAKNTPLSELLGPGEVVDEAELDALVEAARESHYRSKMKNKR